MIYLHELIPNVSTFNKSSIHTSNTSINQLFNESVHHGQITHLQPMTLEPSTHLIISKFDQPILWLVQRATNNTMIPHPNCLVNLRGLVRQEVVVY